MRLFALVIAVFVCVRIGLLRIFFLKDALALFFDERLFAKLITFPTRKLLRVYVTAVFEICLL